MDGILGESRAIPPRNSDVAVLAIGLDFSRSNSCAASPVG